MEVCNHLVAQVELLNIAMIRGMGDIDGHINAVATDISRLRIRGTQKPMFHGSVLEKGLQELWNLILTSGK